MIDLTQFEKIITLGPKGTFSNQAAATVGGDIIKDIIYTTTIPQIGFEVANNENYLGVMPVENSTSGMVGQAQDSLVDNNIVIVNELQIDIHYCLVCHCDLQEVKRFYSHSEAFNQTMVFTSKHLPNAEVVFSNSNIHSGELFLERPDEPVAAIIPKPIALLEPKYKEKIVAENIQDYEQNITRFVVIHKKPEDYQPDFSKRKTSMMIEFKEDRHSMLFELLREFHVFGINLCRLESRPIKNTPWRYKFFIDMYNNHRLIACMEELKKQDIGVKIFGSFNRITV